MAQLEQLSIASPEHSKQHRLLATLESAFTPDHGLPRLRPQLEPTREKRKAAFSSDDDDDERDTFSRDSLRDTDNTDNVEPYAAETYTDYGDYDADEKGFFSKTQSLTKTLPPSPKPVKEEPKDDAGPEPKRRRGRPKKGEAETKTRTVTRRSKRIVENPTLQTRRPAAAQTAPKPLRALGLAQLAPPAVKLAPDAVLLSEKPAGKQRPLTIDAERLFTASSRDRRFNLTTLDVLRQFVEEHVPRPAANAIVNENTVLTEFKAHLKYNLAHLADVHASIADLSHDVAELQRRKNDTRRAILELKKKHAAVGTELARQRRTHASEKEKHEEFMLVVRLLNQLRTETTGSLSVTTLTEFADVRRVLHGHLGLGPQLQDINAGLAQRLRNRDHIEQ